MVIYDNLQLFLPSQALLEITFPRIPKGTTIEASVCTNDIGDHM